MTGRDGKKYYKSMFLRLRGKSRDRKGKGKYSEAKRHELTLSPSENEKTCISVQVTMKSSFKTVDLSI